ncbi:MAG: TrkA family potassium uptake protein [Roseiflexaceae bacterium]
MNVLIIGGGKVGRNLAQTLVSEGKHRVTVIELRNAAIHKLKSEVTGITIIEGDGCDPHILREAGVERADAVAAVTGDDEDNLVVAQISKREFRVARVAARINNPKNAWLFTSRMGVDIPVDNTTLLARSLEAEINLGAMVHMLRLREGRVTLVEFMIGATSSAIGRSVADLKLPHECVLAAVLRGEQVILPAGDTRFQAGDQVIALARVEQEAALAERFR